MNGTGTKYLGELFALGGRVRDTISVRLRPEGSIKYNISKYVSWAFRDAGLHNRPNAIPVHTIYDMQNGQSTRSALGEVNCQLISLAHRYRDALRLTPSVEDPPTTGNKQRAPKAQYRLGCSFPVLIGFLICGPIVAVTTLDSNPAVYPDLDAANCKLVSQFDMGDESQDVWNTLAIAIACIRIRKTMLQLEEEGKGELIWAIDDSTGANADEDL